MVMSKRSADVQGSREGWFEGDGTNPRGAMDTPRRATAAQMANRKITRGRAGRRPVASSPAPAFSTNNSVANQQHSQGPFSNIDPNILNNNATVNSQQQQQQSGTPFGQQNGPQGGIFFGASQSLAPNTSSNSHSTNQGASFGGFGSVSNTGANISAHSSPEFNFSPAATVNNPFSKANAPVINPRSYSGTWASVGGNSQGFKGSIFNIPAARDSVPQFAPQPSEPLGSLFGQASQSIQSQSTSDTSQRPQTNTDVFGQSSGQQSRQSQPTTNVFGQSSGSTFQSPQSSNLFGQGDDKMQTSPDNTPHKVDVPKPGPFSFLSQQPKIPATDVNTPSSEGNLFARISQPPSTPAPAFTGTEVSTGNNNLFSRISQPASAAQQSGSSSSLFPGLSMSPTTSSPLAPNELSKSTASGVFSGVSNPSNPAISAPAEQLPQANGLLFKPPRPIATPGSSMSAQGTAAPINPFANIKMPPMSQAASRTPGAKLAQSDSTTGFQIKGFASLPSPATSFQEPSAPFTPPSAAQPPRNYDTIMGMPPPGPAHFTEVQQQQYVTGYRIRSLNQGFQKHVVSMTGLKDIDIAVRFYTEKREEINGAGGLPREGLTGSKRKSSGDETVGEASHLNKKTKSDFPTSNQSTTTAAHTPAQKEKLTNGVNGAASVSQDRSGFSTEPSTSSKRKADEDIVRDDANVNMGGSKKARSEAEVSYPSLLATTPAKEGSQTSNIFKNILNKADRGKSAATPKPLTNGTSGNSFLAPGPSDAPALTNAPASLFTAKPAATSMTSSFPFQSENIPSKQPEAPKSPFTFKPATTSTAAAEAPKSPFTFKPVTTSTVAAEAPKSPFTFKPATTSSRSALAPNCPFTIKPAADSDVSTGAVKPPTVKPPMFGSGSSVNFMAQFGQSAAQSERKEKEKRKADDFDSDEDDEVEWERKDAEEQRAKKQKIAEAAKGMTAVFIPGKGFVFSEGEKSNGAVVEDKPATASAPTTQTNASEPAVSAGRGLFGSGASTPSTAGGTSVFDSPNLAGQQKSLSSTNIFGHLSDADSGVDGSKTEDADDEDTGSEGDDEGKDANIDDGKNSTQEPPPTDTLDQRSESDEAEDIQSILRKSRSAEGAAKGKMQAEELSLQRTAPGKSLFDRISKDGNGNNIRQLPSTEEKKPDGPFNASPSASTITFFRKTSPSTSSFGQPSSSTPGTSIFGSSVSPAGDHTWKQNSPIKFGGPTAAPTLTLTTATPSKGTSGEDQGTPPSPFAGLFGSPKSTIESPAKLSSNMIGTPTKSADVGFGFGGPPKIVASSLLAPSAPTSGVTSRATSPGMTTDTGGESANESTAEGAETENPENAQQLNLTVGGPGEEDEDVLIEVRAKAMMWVAEMKDDDAKPGWENKGLGPLRVLKHRHSGKARIIMRLEPSGRLVLNAALLSGVDYQHQAPSAVKMAVASEDGKLNTWVVKVKKDEDAIKLANTMEENKSR